jgi:hypothetical protein
LDREIPLVIRREIALFSGALAVDDHGRTWHQLATGVGDGPGDCSSVRGLTEHRQSAEYEYSNPEQSVERVQRLVPQTITTAGGNTVYYSAITRRFGHTLPGGYTHHIFPRFRLLPHAFHNVIKVWRSTCQDATL